MSWQEILKSIRAIGQRFTVDGKTYHLSPEQIEEYKKEYNNPHLSEKDSETKKRIALRNVVRKYGLNLK
tara:strand:+ start:6609 stop:6815 length:207 start_codon:yes stop_codon:yes gene_type:complete